MSKQRLDFTAEYFKALGSPCRLRIIKELRQGELTVTQLRDRLQIELPKISQELAILKSRQMVVARKQGIYIYYSCSDPGVFDLLDQARAIIDSRAERAVRELEFIGEESE
ncbi:MAG TPA: metalloregulator ArsR/SmtB family transcription factor [Chroococcales cyanobacterium]